MKEKNSVNSKNKFSLDLNKLSKSNECQVNQNIKNDKFGFEDENLLPNHSSHRNFHYLNNKSKLKNSLFYSIRRQIELNSPSDAMHKSLTDRESKNSRLCRKSGKNNDQ